uniref:Protein regulator of cytokinesis 1 n=2 Tax=Parascaris univalens TaxID=6257 RepID=A0A915C9P7_PARUN
MSASRRRISVDLSTAEAVTVIRGTMDRLNALWDEVYMDEAQRVSRVECFYRHIKSLMNEMIESESEMVISVKASINDWLPEINEMRAELGLPAFETHPYRPESVGLYRALDKERTRLTALREDRLNGQRQMVEEMRNITMRLGQEAGEIPDQEKIWDDETLSRLQERVIESSRELSERMGRASQWQTDLQRWYHQMGKAPVSEATKTFIDIALDDQERVFDVSFMDEFKDAHRSARIEYNEWIEQAQFDYTEAMVKLEELWDLCHVAESERRFAHTFNPSTNTAADLEKLLQEVDKLSRFYEERLNVYAKLKEWKDLWAEKVEYESHANDKNSYKNRGGQLQVALQRQKYIATHLPIVLKELKAEVEKYNAKREPHEAILIDGQTPCEHVEWIMEEYRAQKELDRMRKKQATCGGLNQVKITPKKRNADGFFASPATSSKFAKTHSHGRIPPHSNRFVELGTPTRFHQLSMSTTSLHSVIKPAGPKTSSPKTAASQPMSPFSAKKKKPSSKTPTPLKARQEIP